MRHFDSVTVFLLQKLGIVSARNDAEYGIQNRIHSLFQVSLLMWSSLLASGLLRGCNQSWDQPVIVLCNQMSTVYMYSMPG